MKGTTRELLTDFLNHIDSKGIYRTHSDIIDEFFDDSPIYAESHLEPNIPPPNGLTKKGE